MVKFIFKKSRPRITKARSRNSQEILDRIERYLNGNAEEPAQILTGFWKDQKAAITYSEIRQIVLAGMVTYEQIEAWRQDYSVLVSKLLGSMWEKAVEAGAYSQPVLGDRHFKFDMTAPGVDKWITERGAQFVTLATEEQKKAISALLVRGVQHNSSVDEIARNIRACIGLTRSQATAAANYYEHMKATLREQHPKMWDSTIEEKARHNAQMYAERAHRQRAMTVARTEMAHAYNQGADLGMRQAYSENLVGAYKKVWSTSGDDRVCQHCAALDGQEVGMDGKFDFGKGLFTGGEELPPAHPNCVCAVEYVEIEEPSGDMLSQDSNNYMEMLEDVTGEYLQKAKPGIGIVVPEEGFEEEKYPKENKIANWLHKTFGGTVIKKKDVNKDKIKTPDFDWNGKLWELKSTTTEKAALDAVRRGLKQVQNNPGGIILDYEDHQVNLSKVCEYVWERMRRTSVAADIMIVGNEKLLKVLRKKH